MQTGNWRDLTARGPRDVHAKYDTIPRRLAGTRGGARMGSRGPNSAHGIMCVRCAHAT